MMDLMKKSQRIPSIKHNTDRISDLHRNAETLVALDFLGLGSMAINGPDQSSVSIMDRSSASLNPSQLPPNLLPDSSPNLRNMAFNLGIICLNFVFSPHLSPLLICSFSFYS